VYTSRATNFITAAISSQHVHVLICCKRHYSDYFCALDTIGERLNLINQIPSFQ